MTRPVYISAARRSIVAPRGGVLAHLAPHQLASPVLQAVINDAKLTNHQIDEVICGNALGAGGNPARVPLTGNAAAGWTRCCWARH